MSVNVPNKSQADNDFSLQGTPHNSLQLTALGQKEKPMSLSDTGSNSNERCRTRTCDPLIKSQQTKNPKQFKSKELQHTQDNAYKPAYKKIQKTAKNQVENLPNDLAQIISVWPELPEHIKQTIITLVRSV